jgi:hypothetical protein
VDWIGLDWIGLDLNQLQMDADVDVDVCNQLLLIIPFSKETITTCQGTSMTEHGYWHPGLFGQVNGPPTVRLRKYFSINNVPVTVTHVFIVPATCCPPRSSRPGPLASFFFESYKSTYVLLTIFIRRVFARVSKVELSSLEIFL